MPIFHFYLVNITESSMDFSICIFKKNTESILLTISNNNLQEICNVFAIGNKSLLIDFSYNNIAKVTSYCFLIATNLKQIHLDHNSIEMISKLSFANLFKLYYINLANNYLKMLLLLETKLLNYNNNPIILADPSQTVHSLQSVLTLNFRVCCLLPLNYKCTVPISWYKSCNFPPRFS